MTKIFFLTIFLFPLSALAQDEKKTTIVFVCEHGGARSTIASAYFNKMANENHLPYQSIFRGLTPDSVITKETRKGLIEDGFEIKFLSPSPLSEKDVDTNTVFISLDCIPPPSYPMHYSWKGIPMISEDYAAARNTILKCVNNLITDLKTKNVNPKH